MTEVMLETVERNSSSRVEGVYVIVGQERFVRNASFHVPHVSFVWGLPTNHLLGHMTSKGRGTKYSGARAGRLWTGAIPRPFHMPHLTVVIQATGTLEETRAGRITFYIFVHSCQSLVHIG